MQNSNLLPSDEINVSHLFICLNISWSILVILLYERSKWESLMREERAVGKEVKRLSDKSRIRSEELNTERDSGESSDNLDDVRLNCKRNKWSEGVKFLNLTCLTLIFDLDGKIPPARNDMFAPKILTESTILISISCKPELISEEVTFLQLNVRSSKSQPCLAATCKVDSVSTRNKRFQTTFIVLVYVILTKLWCITSPGYNSSRSLTWRIHSLASTSH